MHFIIEFIIFIILLIVYFSILAFFIKKVVQRYKTAITLISGRRQEQEAAHTVINRVQSNSSLDELQHSSTSISPTRKKVRPSHPQFSFFSTTNPISLSYRSHSQVHAIINPYTATQIQSIQSNYDFSNFITDCSAHSDSESDYSDNSDSESYHSARDDISDSESAHSDNTENDHSESNNRCEYTNNPFDEYPLSFSPSLLRASLSQPKTNPNNNTNNKPSSIVIDKLQLLRSRIQSSIRSSCSPLCLPSSSSTSTQTQPLPSNNEDASSSLSPLQTNNDNNNNNNIEKAKEEQEITPRAQVPIPSQPPTLPQPSSPSTSVSPISYNISDESSTIHHLSHIVDTDIQKEDIKEPTTQNDSHEQSLSVPSSPLSSFNDESFVVHHHLSRLELDTHIQEEDVTRQPINTTQTNSFEQSLSVPSSLSFSPSHIFSPSPPLTPPLQSHSFNISNKVINENNHNQVNKENIYKTESVTLIPPQATINPVFPSSHHTQTQPLQPLYTHENRGVFHPQRFPALIQPDWWMILVGNLIYLGRNRFYFVDHLIAGSTKSAIFTVYNEQGVRLALKITGKQEYERFKALPTHHGIIKVLDWEPCPESNYWAMFVMEHAECTLSDWVRFGTGKTLQQKQKYVKAVLETVSFLHSKGFMCGDISPNNFVLVNDHGKKLLKMIDFEQAQRVVSGLGHVAMFVQDILFTPGYLAPELTEMIGTASPIWMLSQKNDTFSVGAVAFYILFSYSPGLHIKENFKTSQRFDLYVLKSLTSGKICSVELGQKIAQLLSFFPSHRPKLETVVNSLSWIHVDKSRV